MPYLTDTAQSHRDIVNKFAGPLLVVALAIFSGSACSGKKKSGDKNKNSPAPQGSGQTAGTPDTRTTQERCGEEMLALLSDAYPDQSRASDGVYTISLESEAREDSLSKVTYKVERDSCPNKSLESLRTDANFGKETIDGQIASGFKTAGSFSDGDFLSKPGSRTETMPQTCPNLQTNIDAAAFLGVGQPCKFSFQFAETCKLSSQCVDDFLAFAKADFSGNITASEASDDGTEGIINIDVPGCSNVDDQAFSSQLVALNARLASYNGLKAKCNSNTVRFVGAQGAAQTGSSSCRAQYAMKYHCPNPL